MVWSERLFQDVEHPLIEGFRELIFPLMVVEERQIVERSRDVWVVRAKGFFSNMQRSLIEGFRQLIFPLVVVEERQNIQQPSKIRMFLAPCLFLDTQSLLI